MTLAFLFLVIFASTVASLDAKQSNSCATHLQYELQRFSPRIVCTQMADDHVSCSHTKTQRVLFRYRLMTHNIYQFDSFSNNQFDPFTMTFLGKCLSSLVQMKVDAEISDPIVAASMPGHLYSVYQGSDFVCTVSMFEWTLPNSTHVSLLLEDFDSFLAFYTIPHHSIPRECDQFLKPHAHSIGDNEVSFNVISDWLDSTVDLDVPYTKTLTSYPQDVVLPDKERNLLDQCVQNSRPSSSLEMWTDCTLNYARFTPRWCPSVCSKKLVPATICRNVLVCPLKDRILYLGVRNVDPVLGRYVTWLEIPPTPTVSFEYHARVESSFTGDIVDVHVFSERKK